MTKKNKHLCADATYKLIQHGYPILLVGTTDRDKVFHPFGIAMCSNETDEAFKCIFSQLKILLKTCIISPNYSDC